MCPHDSDAIPIVLLGERHLLELISEDAPLTEVLDEICAALDVEVGNVVSVVLSSEDDVLHELAERAVQFGLYVFSCCAILSQSGQLLGTLETYSYLSENPAVNQAMLIQHASELAALAIQRYDRVQNSWGSIATWACPSNRSMRNRTTPTFPPYASHSLHVS